ncbi:MAG: 30S ribosome-binding factor RbfA [Lactobacillaceae bacterium]|nr:30S ribosome-binding factor RbfA [Lactobacillaceae bacterium]
MKEKSNRLVRVETEIQREISEILIKNLSDPRLENVTITGVSMSPDFGVAHVYWTVYSKLASVGQKAQAGLESSKGEIKKLLAKKMTTFRIPELIFERDQAIEYGDKIEGLLAGLNINHDSTPMDDDEF